MKNILEPPVVLLENGVFGTQIKWPLFVKRHIKATPRKARNGLVGVEHAHGNPIALKLVDLPSLGGGAVVGREGHGQLALALYGGVGSTVLIAKSVATNDNGLVPRCYQAGYILNYNGLPKHRSVENIADGAVGRPPHLLESKFFNSRLVGRYGRALNAYVVLFNGLRRIHGHLIVGGVPVLHSKIVVL